MVAHDVSRELRDPHGKWTRGGAVLERLAHEAATGGEARATTIHPHPEVKRQLEAIPMNKGKRINGVPTGRSKKGFYVRLADGSKNYQSSHHAATAVIEGKHNADSPGSAPVPAPKPPAAPSPPSGPVLSEAEKRDVSRARSIADLIRTGHTPSLTEHKELTRGMNVARNKLGKDSPEHKELIKAYRTSQARRRGAKASEPGPPSAPKPEEKQFRRAIAEQGRVAHPRSLDVVVRATADEKKRMRQKVLKATTHQAEVTPELVDKTQITVTRTPHGRKKTRALASHSGLLNTLHVKPEVLVGDNAQAVLDNGRNSGWWVPTDKEHDLAHNVLTHEFGHGVHGELIAQGWLSATRHNPATTSPTEHKFWTGLADAMNKAEPHSVQPPAITNDYYGRPSMNVVTWMARNKGAITRHVGRYGASNPNEMMAELWTEYRLSSTPRPAAKYVGDWAVQRLDDTYHSKRLAAQKAAM